MVDWVEKTYIDHETGIWQLEKRIMKRHRCDLVLAGAISMMFNRVKRIADVGCGNGRYCAILKAIDKNRIVHGYEGTPNISSLGFYDDIREVDLTKELIIKEKYDLVICLEVGEHIPKKYEQTFIDNLCKYGNRNFVISWAVEGQSGTGHPNCRSNEYIISEFKKRKFKFDKEKSDILRKYSYLEWFKNTVMVYNGRNN